MNRFPFKWIGVVLLIVLGVFWYRYSLGKDSSTSSSISLPRLISPSSSVRLVPTLRLKGYGSKAEENFWREKIHEFEMSRKCAVLVEWTPDESRYFSGLRATKVEESPWDVVMMNHLELETFYQANLLTPLAIPQEWEVKMIPSILSLYRRGDFYEGVPFSFSTLALYYNRSLFDRKGAAYPQDHWSWDDLLAMARGLYVESQGGKSIYGLQMSWDWRLLNLAAGQTGEILFSEDFQMKTEGSRGSVQSLQWFIDLAQNYSIDIPWIQDAEVSAFEKGEVALAVAGPELMNRLKKHHDFIWGVTCLPHGKIRSNTLTTQAWSVWSGAKQRELAYELTLYLSQQAAFFEGLPVYSVSTEISTNPPDSFFYESISQSNPLTPHPLFFYWRERVQKKIDEMIHQSGGNAMELLESINAEIRSHPQYPKPPQEVSTP